MLSTLEVGKKIVELSSVHKALEAVSTLYADNVVSVEAEPMMGGQTKTEGKAAILAKNQWWMDNHDVHGMTVEGPWPHGDRFIVMFKIDVTAKGGPMSGKRFSMQECGLYTVKDGKVVKEEFFYAR